MGNIRKIGWVTLATVGVVIVVCLSCTWNFAHTYILAGGDNPLLILEGKWPAWAGAALAVALAAVGADFLKVCGGFLLFGAFDSKRGWRRLGAVTVALLVITPTMAWSVVSATGMVSLVFGDTVASRGNDKAAAQSLAARIEQGQARLFWLEKQTSDVGQVRRANAKEAAELRLELKQNRTELRSSRAVGAAHPSAQVIADLSGLPLAKVQSYVIALFILMVEVITVCGLPAIALATAVTKASEVTQNLRQTQTNSIAGDFSGGKPQESQGESATPQIHSQNNSFLPARTLFERLRKDMTDAPPNGDTTNEAETPKIDRKKPPGRPKNGKRQDGHMGAFVDLCRERGEKPRRKTYVRFCRDEHIGPLSSGEFHYALKLLRLRHLPPKTVAQYFDTQAGMNGKSLAH